MRKLLVLITFGLVVCLVAPQVAEANVTRAQAVGKVVLRGQINCNKRWGKDCQLDGAWATGPHSNKFGRTKWYAYAIFEAPDGHFWEQYAAYDNYGNRLASSFIKLPVNDNGPRQ